MREPGLDLDAARLSAGPDPHDHYEAVAHLLEPLGLDAKALPRGAERLLLPADPVVAVVDLRLGHIRALGPLDFGVQQVEIGPAGPVEELIASLDQLGQRVGWACPFDLPSIPYGAPMITRFGHG